MKKSANLPGTCIVGREILSESDLIGILSALL